uniref:B-box protein n=1 Tax=Ginkgo biloba TaxID=3311 RepID=A0A7L8Y839_GINBI|nr:B-box protein [Ginkgo biloba]|eukprot:Gb_39727 [translate_table: standard]
MRIQCDVCEAAPASMICCADEAALCVECDIDVHAANKLASKHQRLPLLPFSSYSKLPRCDICQEKAAIVFCVEDRALLCRDCDEPIHAPGTLAAKHQRLLATGIRVALNEESRGPPQESNPPPKVPPPCKSFPSNSTFSVQSIQGSANASSKKAAPSDYSSYEEPCWTVDELLPLSDFDKGDPASFGEFDWDITAAEAGMGLESLAQVPQLRSPPTGKLNLPVKGKTSKPEISIVPEFDEAFIVPDISGLDTQPFHSSPPPAKRRRYSTFELP